MAQAASFLMSNSSGGQQVHQGRNDARVHHRLPVQHSTEQKKHARVDASTLSRVAN